MVSFLLETGGLLCCYSRSGCVTSVKRPAFVKLCRILLGVAAARRRRGPLNAAQLHRAPAAGCAPGTGQELNHLAPPGQVEERRKYHKLLM